MPQPTLFDADVSELVLADDDRGRIVYVPRFVDRPTTEAWFAELRREGSGGLSDGKCTSADEIRKGFPIALVSLGATRRMTIRAKTQPRRVIHVDLEPGSLLVMEYETQLHYTHAVPKNAERAGERISLAFRVKPERERKKSANYEAP